MILTVTPNPCVDKTVYLDRLEAGTFMRAHRCTCAAGGKGVNVSRAVKILGRPTKALVLVGGHSGAHVVDMIRQRDGVDCVPVWVESPTRTITTVLEEPIHRQTAFFEPGSRVTADEARAFRDAFVALLAEARVVAFCGTVPDRAVKTLYRDLIPLAKEAGCVTILDSHGEALSPGLDAVPHLVKPNLAELEALLGRPLPADRDKFVGINYIHQGLGIEYVVVSLGSAGAIVSYGTDMFQCVPPAAREVNPVGSGDALVAGFAIGLMEDMPLREMAILGVAAGAANAASWDIGHFSASEVERLIAEVRIAPFNP